MIRKIYKLISVILINSLLVCNLCSVCHAKDFTFTRKSIFIVVNFYIYIPYNLIGIKDPQGINYTKLKHPNNIVDTYTYDENGNIKTVTDKDGLKTTYTYDENDNEVIRTTGLIETNKRYDADNRLIRIKNEHRFTGELIDEYSYRYDSNNNIIEEIKREPYRKKGKLGTGSHISDTFKTQNLWKKS